MMHDYIALFRGINVGGHRIIKMEALRTLLADAGYKEVNTYIQSGNVFFRSAEADRVAIATHIENLISGAYNFEVAVILTTPTEIREIIKENAYAKQGLSESVRTYVCFLSDMPARDKVILFESLDFGDDLFAIRGKVVYLLYGQSSSNSKLTNSLIEKKLGVSATSRNWNTVLRLGALSQ